MKRIEPRKKKTETEKLVQAVGKLKELLEEAVKEEQEEAVNAYFESEEAEQKDQAVERLLKKPEVVIKPKPSAEDKPVYNTYEDFDFHDLQVYAGLDCIATSELLARQVPLLIEEPVLRVDDPNGGSPKAVRGPAVMKSVLEVIHPCHEFIMNLEINGFKYDIPKNREFGQRMTTEVGELEERIFTQIGKRINLNSGPETSAYVYGELGMAPPFQTKSGDDATDGAAFLTLAGLDPLGRDGYTAKNPDLQFLADMAKRKDINSVYNSFIKTYVEDWVKPDGRIHPSYNMHGTSSFRISGQDPNLTNLPRPKHGYNVRECYTVDVGYCLITFDFSSAEVKILGAICQDENMLNAIAKKMDFHSFSASAMLGMDYHEFVAVVEDKFHEKYKEFKLMRQIAKTLTFSILYGSSAGGIAMQLNVSKDEAERLMAMYFKAYPGVKRYIDESHRMAQRNHRIWTPFGQYKHEYVTRDVFKQCAAYNAALRNAQNVRIQSPTSTLGLLTFAEMDRRVSPYGAKSICTVYDSIELEVPIEKAAEVLEIGFQCMDDWPTDNFKWLTLPIGSEAEIGYNWGQVETVHRGADQAELEGILARHRAKA